MNAHEPRPSPARRTRRTALVVCLVALGLLATPIAADATEGTTPGATVTDAPADAVVLHVEAGAAVDELTDGSASRPLPTIGWAVAYGQSLRKKGYAVHVLVRPGTYRETVSVGWAGDDPRPLVLESAVPGAAVVTGADIESRWTPIDGTGLVSAPWDLDWGLTPVPGSWSGVHVPDGIRRREAVLVDGAPLAQVLTEAELVAGTFYVDETGDRLLVDPPAGVDDLRDHAVEVARRSETLRIKGLARAVAVKGFAFEAGAAPLERHMAYITDSTDVLIEGNTFRHSSWGGLGICCTTGITARGNRVVDNGGNGLDTYKTRSALIEGNHIEGNNVLGARHGYRGWSVAGSKNLLLSQAVFRDNTYTANLARGLWLDTDVRDVLIEGDRSCGNVGDGLFIEATQGPVTIQDSTFCDNSRAGIAVGTSGNVTLQRSTLADNGYGQLVFTGDRTRSWIDHLTGELITLGDFADWTLIGNTFSSAGSAPLIYSPVIPLVDWEALLLGGEITARDNTWTRPSMDGAIRIQSSNFSMADWGAMTGETVAEETPVEDVTEPVKGNKGGGQGGAKPDSTKTDKVTGNGKR